MGHVDELWDAVLGGWCLAGGEPGGFDRRGQCVMVCYRVAVVQMCGIEPELPELRDELPEMRGRAEYVVRPSGGIARRSVHHGDLAAFQCCLVECAQVGVSGEDSHRFIRTDPSFQ